MEQKTCVGYIIPEIPSYADDGTIKPYRCSLPVETGKQTCKFHQYESHIMSREIHLSNSEHVINCTLCHMYPTDVDGLCYRCFFSGYWSIQCHEDQHRYYKSMLYK